MILLVLGVSSAVRTVGAVLTGALLVAPAAAARLLCRRLPVLMAVSVLISVACGVGGLYLSYHAGLPSGAAIALLCAAAYGAAHVATSGRAKR
jgi:ABC-type Mn2+/Zn2+ transport system permease subunit